MFTKVDRMTMAVSLEARSPFADYRIAEFAARLPADIKFRGFQLKSFLKYAFKGLLPHHILHRRKHGFSTPLDKWLRNDLFDLVQSTLGEERLTRQGLLNVSEVRSLVEAHYSNKANNGLKIFMLMTLSLWMEKYGIQR
jgi:asparagine synthase (glutamine-hydrolysing)